jgi:hypothetical protein
MLSSLIVLAVLQLSSDAPRLTVPESPAYSLLAPVSGPVGGQGHLLVDQDPEAAPSHEVKPGDILRPIGGFFAGAGLQLVAGSLIYLVEAVAIFGTAILGYASGGNEGVARVLEGGGLLMILLNAPLLPLLGALPVHGIAQGDKAHRYSFLATWGSGLITYGAMWGIITLATLGQADRGWVLVNYGYHLGSWALSTLVQTIVVQLTRESVEPATQAVALLNVDGRRMAWGPPLPALMPDRSRPGQVVPSVLLAQGRF